MVAHVLIIDDERSMREFLKILLEQDGHEVSTADDVAPAVEACRTHAPDLVFTDLKLPSGSGMDVLRFIREQGPDTQVIMMTAYATTETAVDAMRLGAYDYQLKPFKVEELRVLTQKALEKQTLLRENRALKAELGSRKGLSRLLGRSARMSEVVALIEKVAPTKASVLVEGESGTGKELVARAIHELSPRGQGPFVAINCGAIPENLIEAELFGHAAGAFTGASRQRAGLFEAAHTGTLLLAEVSELPLPTQVKLLRALQERTVRRVGEDSDREVDVRIIASTNRDLMARVASGQFREDLFYRLNVVRIRVPPLRERVEDIPLLARAVLLRYAREVDKPVEAMAPAAERALVAYGFPGNVRELENCLQRAVALAGGTTLLLSDLPDEIKGGNPTSAEDLLAFPEAGLALEPTLEAIERRFITTALERAGGVKKRAAEMLGLSFRSFRYRLRKLGIEIESDDPASGE
ncbi:MAG: sigma-54-dependent Fis family transcriptional regulator [Deltaproteobacteria bacterium]|nr:sigma-54-dependent Fis family transcriptional regulator [Deltaproteobacteria bacterium]